MKKIDLHVHSNYSDDADLTPQELIEMAMDRGLAAISITDHNLTDAISEALELVEDNNLEIIPGIEFDTNYGDNILHILGYYIDYNSPKIDELLGGMEEAKKEQFYGRIERLQQLGFNITAQEVLEKADNDRPLGGFIAEVLLAKTESKEDPRLETYYTGEKSDQPYFNFYLDFFRAGQPADIPCWKPSAKDTIKLIKEIGGVAVLAHPGSTLSPEDEDVIDDLIEAGLQGIESYSTYHNEEEVAEWLALAEKKGLLATAGSDFHGHLKPKIELGGVAGNDYNIIEQLRELRRSNK
ncbi:PHP domain-containing protein [Orenia metallireducens]|uniref:PHP domain-containing protein n=1 Tax=Orenia metallireducens TaxID=1413210 RepID=A0A1C0A540_9FIRM|nr:PHP domain-containing protein [Orenia metallireducens]OCL25251.1 PHP domain-containing protein [Orenia metallireducens]